MQKKIISVDKLSRFKSKYDTKVSGELALKSDKTYVDSEIGSLKDYTDGKLATKEDSTNKVTSLSGSSTDTQYPSAKCVYDNLQNVREVAEGKCKAYVVSFQETEPTQENFIANRWKDADGNPFATWSDFQSYVSGEDFGNDLFNDQDTEVSLFGYYFITYDGIVIINNNELNVGDIILVIETDVPDRWYGGFYNYEKLETATLDPSGYVDDHTIAPAYSNQLTYAVGDLVIYDHKLYRCITAVSSAENFDSTKWTQASVSDTFVDLYRNQTISGAKTFINTFLMKNNARIKFGNSYGDGYAFKNKGDGYLQILNNYNSPIYDFDNSGFINRENKDLGSSSYKWKDLYLSGSLKDGTNSVSVADLAALIAYAKAQGWIS